MNKILIAFAALLGLLVAALFLVPQFVDWNRYRSEIQAAVEQATGRRLTIEGDVHLVLLPAPELAMGEVTLANLAGGSAPDMVEVKALDLKVRLAPLFAGRIEIERATLVKPVILVERLADGTPNWIFSPATKSGGGLVASDLVEISLDRLAITDGTLTYRDKGRAEYRVEALTGALTADSLDGPFQATGQAQLGSQPVTFEIASDRIAGSAPASIRVTLGTAAGEANLQLIGSLAGGPGGARVTGTLSGKARDLGASLAALTGRAMPALLERGFELNAEIAGAADGAQAHNIRVALGDTVATGEASYAPPARDGGPAKATLALAATFVDLDALLSGDPGKPVAGVPPGAPGTKPEGPATLLPAKLDLAITLSAEGMRLRGAPIGQPKLSAHLAKGKLKIDQFNAVLPGASPLDLVGVASAGAEGPRFDGHLKLRSDNLRMLIDWLGAAAPQVAPDRLRTLKMVSEIAATPERVELSKIEASLDTSKLSGGIIMALRERPAFGIGLSIDRLDLDAYWPPSQEGAAESGAPPLAILGKFDANLALFVGELDRGDQSARRVRLEGTLDHGALKIREASIADLAGGKGTLSGTVKDLAGDKPTYDLSLDVDLAHPETALGLAGLRFAGLETLGSLGAKGQLVGDLDEIAFDLSLSAPRLKGEGTAKGKAGGFPDKPHVTATLDLGTSAPGPLLALAGIDAATADGLGALALAGSLSIEQADIAADLSLSATGPDAAGHLAGRVAPFAAEPALDGTVRLQAAKPAALFALLGWRPAGIDAMGALDLSLNGKGTLGALQLEGTLGVLGGQAALKGGFGMGSSAGPFSISGTLKHPAAEALVKLIQPTFAQSLGPAELELDVTGDPGNLHLGHLAGRVGPSEVDGHADIGWTGARPRIDGALHLSSLSLDGLIPAAPAGTAPWSDAPLGLSFISALDGALDLKIDALAWKGLTLDQGTARAVVQDGTLTIAPIAGQLDEGSFDAGVTLGGGDHPSLAIKLGVVGAKLAPFLAGAGSFGVSDGTFDIDADMRATGASPLALVETLAGQGKVAARDGAVRGLDLAMLGDRLKGIQKPGDLAELVDTATKGGTTKFSRLGGTFILENGILRSRDLSLEAEGGKIEGETETNLPDWTTDTNLRLTVAGAPESPPIILRLVGPLDAPAKQLDVASLENDLLNQGIDSVVNKLLNSDQKPEKTKAPEVEPKPSAEPAPGAELEAPAASAPIITAPVVPAPQPASPSGGGAGAGTIAPNAVPDFTVPDPSGAEY